MSSNDEYDSTLKGLFQQRPAELLPQIVKGVTYLETLNIELLRPPLRTDRLFKVMYKGELHIMRTIKPAWRGNLYG